MTHLWKNKTNLISLLVFFLSLPLFFLFDNATSLVWTAIIPLLPIVLIIIGFSRWRNICPLAGVSKISQNINWFQKKKVPTWVQNHFYLIQYFSLFLVLTLRLTTLNFNSFYLVLYLVLIFVSAFITNLIYTGKSWCNYYCPVGVVERIYCLSNAKNYMRNSACSTCTACKKNCPDIDMESNYWKENMSFEKSFVFYSFSGLILGFYLYFYLESGSFSYYFSGDWTSIHLSSDSAGFFFAPFIPVFVAAPLTLIVFALLSFLFFWAIETYLWRYQILKNTDYPALRHKMKVVASFVAFNTFYIFAGAPSYSQYPFFYSILYFFIVSISSMLLYKEFFRQEIDLIQERFALKIIKRWEKYKDISSDLKEIYYRYINETKNKRDILKSYKENIEELLRDGILDEGSIVSLEKLREQLGISRKDHFEVIRNIKLQNDELFDDTKQKSTETKYQQDSYKSMILKALNTHSELDINYIKSLQQQFNISDERHKEIMSTILNTEEDVNSDILQLLDKLYLLLKTKNSIFNDKSRELVFLRYIIKSQFRLVVRNLFSLLFVIYKDNKDTLKILLDLAKENQVPDDFEFTKETLSFMSNEISDKLLLIKNDFFPKLNTLSIQTNRFIIPELIQDKSIEIATASLLCTNIKYPQTLEKVNLDRFILHPNSVINEVALKIQNHEDTTTIYERMMYLSYIPIFKDIRYYDLKLLAKSTIIKNFTKDTYVIKQGGVGDTLFVLMKGKVSVEVDGKQIRTLDDKDYFGDVAIMGNIKRPASIKATEDLKILTISKIDFQNFLEDNPKLYKKLMKNIIKKLLELQGKQQ